MPEAVTAIALGHHVTTDEEWFWFATTDDGQRCDADDHTRAVCEAIKAELEKLGHKSKLVDYPGESGLQFRYVAQAAGLGKIGTNAFLLHPAWGPWIHLRVLMTTAVLDVHPALKGGNLCDQCGVCVSECPAGALLEEDFDGHRCRSYRGKLGEYVPRGPDRRYDYCEICARVCPLGEEPFSKTRSNYMPPSGSGPTLASKQKT